MNRACAVCGKEFSISLFGTGQGRRKIYCSDRCYEIQRTGHDPKQYFRERHCEHCGQMVCGRITKRFCSKICCEQSRNVPKIMLCAICNSQFTSHGFGFTCSDRCRALLVHLTRLRNQFFRTVRILRCRKCSRLFYKDGPSQRLCAPCQEAVRPLIQYQTDLKRGRNANPPSEKTCSGCGSVLAGRAKLWCATCLPEETKRKTIRYLSRKTQTSNLLMAMAFSTNTKPKSK